VMNYLTQHGLHHPGLMGFALKLMANITDTRGGDVGDRLINGLSRLAPTA
jgi:menaquinone-9 beta-reductase